MWTNFGYGLCYEFPDCRQYQPWLDPEAALDRFESDAETGFQWLRASRPESPRSHVPFEHAAAGYRAWKIVASNGIGMDVPQYVSEYVWRDARFG